MHYYYEFPVTRLAEMVTKNIMTSFCKARLNYAPINVMSNPPGRGAYGGIWWIRSSKISIAQHWRRPLESNTPYPPPPPPTPLGHTKGI